MKALILAAGYATRLYPLTEHQPKALLTIKGKPLLEHILEKIKTLPEISEVFVVTNHRFYDTFRVWLEEYQFPKKIKLVDDGTLSNADRLGAVGDLHFAVQEEDLHEDLLVIAGDNLFGFSLKDFVASFKKVHASLVAFHDLKKKELLTKRYGVGVLEGSKLVHFEEKPALPRSSLASTACYLFTAQDLSHLEKALQSGKADNPGDFIKWLTQKSEVHGFVFDEHWFDVGTFESLQQAQEVYER